THRDCNASADRLRARPRAPRARCDRHDRPHRSARRRRPGCLDVSRCDAFERSRSAAAQRAACGATRRYLQEALMIFNSYVFWAFFAVVLFLYWRLPHRGQNLLLLVASYVFYGYWDWRYLGLLAVSTLIDFFVSNAIHREHDQRTRLRLLVFSIVANLGILGYFKYAGFFVKEFADLLG